MYPLETTRRRLLSAGASLALGSTAGCIESRSPYAPPMVENRPTGAYVPTHYEEMRSVGVDTSGPFTAALSYSYPHRFWLVSDTDRTKVPIRPADTLHLMLTVWETDSGQVLPGLGPTVTLRRENGGGETRPLWPMLSQRTSFHYGDNVHLPGDGTYRVTASIGPPAVHLSSTFSSRLNTGAQFEFEFRWQQSSLDGLGVTMVPKEQRGKPGALPAMHRESVPMALAPTSLPGRSLGTGSVGDVTLSASLESSEDGEGTVLVAATTPYNGFPITMLGVLASIPGRSEPIGLSPAVDPTLGIHYRGTVPAVKRPRDVTVHITTPAQVARHEGYETAFFETGSTRLQSR